MDSVPQDVYSSAAAASDGNLLEPLLQPAPNTSSAQHLRDDDTADTPHRLGHFDSQPYSVEQSSGWFSYDLDEARVQKAAALISDAVKGKFEPLIVHDSKSIARHRVYTICSKLRYALLVCLLALTWFERPAWCMDRSCGDPEVVVRTSYSVLSKEATLWLEATLLLLFLLVDDVLQVSFKGVYEWTLNRVNVVKVFVYRNMVP